MQFGRTRAKQWLVQVWIRHHYHLQHRKSQQGKWTHTGHVSHPTYTVTSNT